MIKEFIGTGKTIDEATIAAKAGLNAPLTADVSIEVVAMPKKKILGLFGGSEAQVKASYDDGKNEKKPKPKKSKPVQEKKPVAKKPDAPKKAPQAVKQAQEIEKINDSDIDLDYVCAYLKTMIDSFKVEDAKVTAKIVDGVIEIDIESDDYGIVIGRRGETLDALQYLTSLAVKKSTDKYVRVTLNVGDYRTKREQTLKALAVKNANYVVRSGRRYTFEPMNPYERRIIHTAVQEVEGATSRSVGNGMDRKVLIEPVGGVKYSSNNRGGGRRGGAPRSSYTPSKPDPNREKKVDRADMPKFGKIEVNKD